MPWPLGKQLSKNPREAGRRGRRPARRSPISASRRKIAGPGFINLRLKDQWLVSAARGGLADPRLGISPVTAPRTYVIDYSAPNVAKPMHVGHIRSTVIGDALCRTLRFLGHRVISDNHIGDWGTQFGMILYGYKHFLDAEAYRGGPVEELARLYRLVRQLVDYFAAKEGLPELQRQAGREAAGAAARAEGDAAAGKRSTRNFARRSEAGELGQGGREELEELAGEDRRRRRRSEPCRLAAAHPTIGRACWPRRPGCTPATRKTCGSGRSSCRTAWKRSSGSIAAWTCDFDHTLGESFYHDMLPGVVEELLSPRASPGRARGPFASSSKGSRRR